MIRTPWRMFPKWVTKVIDDLLAEAAVNVLGEDNVAMPPGHDRDLILTGQLYALNYLRASRGWQGRGERK